MPSRELSEKANAVFNYFLNEKKTNREDAKRRINRMSLDEIIDYYNHLVVEGKIANGRKDKKDL